MSAQHSLDAASSSLREPLFGHSPPGPTTWLAPSPHLPVLDLTLYRSPYVVEGHRFLAGRCEGPVLPNRSSSSSVCFFAYRIPHRRSCRRAASTTSLVRLMAPRSDIVSVNAFAWSSALAAAVFDDTFVAAAALTSLPPPPPPRTPDVPLARLSYRSAAASV